ncbi:MAG TPA: nucleotidyltransferase family protein [Gemmatimonadales bacterium]|jgi:CTP:molybdopterin cytidylyltransferase MocA|nr:nucleotidyltransferase family protein [Gemmatimonadales bacterium]
MSLAGVVLAGGRSARMGSPKALLDFRGQPFVVRVLEAFEALEVKARVVVVGPDAPRIRPALAGHDCLIVENTDVDGGPIASLRAALRALQPVQPRAVLVWPVDLPHVRVATVERMLEVHRRRAAPAVVPTFAERRGHPVLWGAGLFEELLTSEAAARHGARAVLQAHAAELVSVAVDDPAVIDDLNTPEDYERLVREWNRDIY